MYNGLVFKRLDFLRGSDVLSCHKSLVGLHTYEWPKEKLQEQTSNSLANCLFGNEELYKGNLCDTHLLLVTVKI